jgi:tRNA(His) 5'-end guanylyltransferase
MYSVFIYANRRMKPVEIVLRREGRGREKTIEGVNLTKIYHKHICKYHNVSSAQLFYANKNPL